MHVTMCVLQQNNAQFHTLVASVPCTQQIMSVFTTWLNICTQYTAK
jgi:hypothetical protein